MPFIFLTRRRVGLLSFYFAHHRSMSSKKKRGLLSRDDAKNSWEELCDRIYYSNTYSCVANDLRQLQSYCCCIVCIVYLYSSLYFWKKKQDWKAILSLISWIIRFCAYPFFNSISAFGHKVIPKSLMILFLRVLCIT